MIDIIIPAYNAHKTIKRTLISIILQSIKNKVEVTIVNDGSKCDYSEIIDLFKEKIRIREIKLDKNSGPGVARQEGIDNTTNPYIVFIDADDMLYNTYSLENLYSMILDNDNDYAVGKIIDEKNGEYIYYQNHIGCLHGKIYKREHLENEKIKFNNTSMSEDHSFNRLVTLSTDKYDITEEIIYVYKDEKNSISNREENDILSIKWYIYNAIWTAKEAEKRKYSKQEIAILLNNALTYVYFMYNLFYGNNQICEIVDECISLIDWCNKYDKYISLEDKIDIYKDFEESVYLLPKVSLDDFKKQIKDTSEKKYKKETINILISIDESYVEHAIDTIYSIKLCNDVFINLYLVYNDLSEESIKKIADFMRENNIGVLKPYYIDLTDLDLPIYKDYISITTYCRLFAPFIIEDKIDRLLYLDCDIICTGSIMDFYNSSFGRNVIVACENLVIEERADFNVWRNTELELPEDNHYINAGVLLININKYRKFTSVTEINNFIKDNYDKLFLQDQDVINKMFYGHIKLGSIKYNYQVNSIDLDAEGIDCNLVHYSEEQKPWDEDYTDLNKAMYYYSFLKEKGDVLLLEKTIKSHINNITNVILDDILNK